MSNRPSKGRGKSLRTNVTAHQRAMADPETAALAKELHSQWKGLKKVQRGDRLRHLVSLGCSKRGLADDLYLADVTVRRHIDIASLPEEKRKAVIKGASAKFILETKATEKRRQRSAKRVLEERETGKHSDEVADLVIVFCRAKGRCGRTKILPSELELFLERTAVYLSDLPRGKIPRTRWSKRSGIEGLIKRTRPEENRDELWIERHAKWLAAAIRTVAPEAAIWRRGLWKARRRREELKERKAPLQMYKDAFKRRDAIEDPYQRRRRF